jgi:hypothetical protein
MMAEGAQEKDLIRRHGGYTLLTTVVGGGVRGRKRPRSDGSAGALRGGGKHEEE